MKTEIKTNHPHAPRGDNRSLRSRCSLSLAPGFSRVMLATAQAPAASAAFSLRETAEAVEASPPTVNTRLKPGANERAGIHPHRPAKSIAQWLACAALALGVGWSGAVTARAQQLPPDRVFDPETLKYVTCVVATASSAPVGKERAAIPVAAPVVAKNAVAAKNPVVQIALLLDTSNSMDGLIAQAKSQLWKIVNEFINAKQNGQRPELEVALFEYGKQSLNGAEGYIRLIVPLTNDLDKISEELFALKTHGGNEYCGWVIQEAVAKLAWSARADDFKAIFIAGNEPFTQGPVDFRKSCKAAVEKGIVVNTIHCGNEAQGVSGQWRDGALVADGKFMFIDQSRAVVHYEAPQDKQIAKLGEDLNRTYIAFGAHGAVAQSRQSAQDANASTLASAGAAVNRALCKASDNYQNGAWDLVDACKQKTVNLETMKKEELPAELQKLNEKERKSYVESKAKEREQLQAEINRLNTERSKYVAEEMKKNSQTNTLDQVMIATIREQATKRNYRFE